MDWSDGPLSFMPHWSALSESGVTGDATVATAEKGRIWLDQAVSARSATHIDEVARRHPAAGSRPS